MSQHTVDGRIVSVNVAAEKGVRKEPVESITLVRAVFAVLVLATVAAFFIAQSLKTEVPLVLRFGAQPRDISPNGDRVRDATRVGFDLSEAAEV